MRPPKARSREETDLLVRADTADTVAAEPAEVMALKQVEVTDADASLAETREGLAAAERELERTRKAAEVPAGQAPISDATIRANASHMQADEVWETLSRADKQRVQRWGEPRALMSEQEFRADARRLRGRRRCVMSKKLRNRLARHAIDGTITVNQARAMLGWRPLPGRPSQRQGARASTRARSTGVRTGVTGACSLPSRRFPIRPMPRSVTRTCGHFGRRSETATTTCTMRRSCGWTRTTRLLRRQH